jgi:hypothetical protein
MIYVKLALTNDPVNPTKTQIDPVQNTVIDSINQSYALTLPVC